MFKRASSTLIRAHVMMRGRKWNLCAMDPPTPPLTALLESSMNAAELGNYICTILLPDTVLNLSIWFASALLSFRKTAVLLPLSQQKKRTACLESPPEITARVIALRRRATFFRKYLLFRALRAFSLNPHSVFPNESSSDIRNSLWSTSLH